mmetsp:Transcript_9950/g.20258  ORF Transcript_9950/g.20258 Transcript_9950/m.20258 type:complete len:233 (-) Transcript_9950:1344-2042(-)
MRWKLTSCGHSDGFVNLGLHLGCRVHHARAHQPNDLTKEIDASDRRQPRALAKRAQGRQAEPRRHRGGERLGLIASLLDGGKGELESLGAVRWIVCDHGELRGIAGTHALGVEQSRINTRLIVDPAGRIDIPIACNLYKGPVGRVVCFDYVERLDDSHAACAYLESPPRELTIEVVVLLRANVCAELLRSLEHRCAHLHLHATHRLEFQKALWLTATHERWRPDGSLGIVDR